jgi:hypothetical protein
MPVLAGNVLRSLAAIELLCLADWAFTIPKTTHYVANSSAVPPHQRRSILGTVPNCLHPLSLVRYDDANTYCVANNVQYTGQCLGNIVMGTEHIHGRYHRSTE